MAFLDRIANMIRGRRYERDLDLELSFHIEECADELEARGMSREAALAEARRRFGNRTVLAEKTRDMDLVGWLGSLGADVRYALRAMRRSPGFAVVAVLSLALGIGANTAIFSLLNAVILRSLPVERPGQLVQIAPGAGTTTSSSANPVWEAIRDREDFFDGAFAFQETSFDLSTGGLVRLVAGTWVTGDFFRTLGVRPVAGRLLEVSDDTRGCAATAVLSQGFSEREFGSPAASIGRTISLEGHTFSVVGVSEAAFTGVSIGRSSDIFAPLCATEAVAGDPTLLDQRSSHYLSMMARVPDSLSLDAAQARLSAIAPAVMAATLPQNWRPEFHSQYLGRTLLLRRAAAGLSQFREHYAPALVVLMIVVGVVLLIACANVAHLLLARAAARQREMAIRMAIGAGRRRLVRQLLTESVLLSGFGAAAGILFAYWAAAALVPLLAFRGENVFVDLSPDWRVLAFTVAVAVLTGVLFGLAPAWRATKVSPQAAMKAQAGDVTSGRGRFGMSRALVMGQVALSLTLLVAAGLLLRSFVALTTVDPGFRREGVLLVAMDLANTGFDEPRRRTEHRQILDRVRALPGVTSASASLLTPISGSGWNEELVVEGFTPAGEQDEIAWFNAVSEGYLATMGTELVAGRDVARSDDAAAPAVAVVSESMARRFFGNRNAIGQVFRTRLRETVSPPVTIVGVVRDSKYSRMEEEPGPLVYRPLYQADWWSSRMNYELRASGEQADIMRAVTTVAAQSSRSIGLSFITLEEQVSETLRRPQLMALLSSFFGGLALVLAVIGLYGTMAYGVARRRNEIGVRLALGARRGRVVRMILAEAGWLVTGGIVLGTAGAIGLSQLIRGGLYGVRPTDPVTLVFCAGLLAIVALAAGAVPAWQAAKLDPMTTLREE